MPRRKLRIGELLVQSELISEEELRKALAEPRPQGMKLGEYLVRKGVVTEEAVARVVCQQTGISRYTPEAYPLDISLASRIPAEVAQQTKSVPLMQQGSLLYVGMLDPLDIPAQDRLEVVTDRAVEPVLCLMAEYNNIFSILYGGYTGLDSMVQELELPKEAPEGEALEVLTKQDEDLGDPGSPNDAPVVKLVNALLAQGARERASDIHINPERDRVEMRFRIDGRLRPISSVPQRIGPSLVSRVKILAGMDISVTRIPQDGRFTIKVDGRELNVRVSSLPTVHGENLVLRLLDMSSSRRYSLEELGMSEADRNVLETCARRPYGMILSTGPTGSGKSTSLYAVLQKINSPEVNTITLEDPVEYRVPGIRQVQLNVRAGMTFASGLRAILRQDPDIVMVGEIRDGETAGIAVNAALTGHLVLSTLHTNDAVGAISRLMDMGIEPYLVSSVLQCSFAQRLVRTICPRCRKEYAPDPALLRIMGLSPEDGPFFRGEGCFSCGGTGYLGRIGVFEMLPVTQEIQTAIDTRAPMQEVRRMAREAGMRMLREDAADKVRTGKTTVEEAVRVTMI